jgi:hypothetical protein
MKIILAAVVLSLTACSGVTAQGKGVSYTCVPSDANDRLLGRSGPSNAGDSLVVTKN